MNNNLKKWLSCAVAVTIAVYNASYTVEALESIGNKVELVENTDKQENESSINQEAESLEEESENTTEQDQTDTESMTQAGEFFKVSGTKNTDWEFSDNLLTIKAGENKDITIEGVKETTTDKIVVEAGFSGTITIKNVKICNNEDNSCAFKVEMNDSQSKTTSKTNLILNLEGTNYLKSGENRAGLEFENATDEEYLTIKGEGTLKVIGGAYGAGIGGGKSGYGNNIVIIGVILEAKGGAYGAGIGGGDSGWGKDITIKGGTVTAIGGQDSSGIGDGYKYKENLESENNIIISGGSVKATDITQKINNISTTPKNEENGENVYLVNLKEQNNFGSVEVDGIDYNVATNHSDKNDNDLYLYMPVGNHSIKTNKGLYISNVSESETSKVENAPERISKLISKMNLSGYKGNKLSNVILPDGFVWENEDTILKTTGKYKANFSVDGKYYPILLYVVVTEKNTNDDEESYIPLNPTYTYKEIIGSDRYDTAGLIADKLESYNTAILVNAESSISDGLSAAGLAGKENASILLVKKDNVPQSTLNRLKKVKKVYIIGGENAISQKVVGQINKINPNIEMKRLGGKTRVETSEIVAKEIGNYSNAFMVNGFKREADAMSASSVAAKLE